MPGEIELRHLVFRKQYTSKARFLQYQHEQAYLLAKGTPALPSQPISDVIDMPYSGNKLHPTQKSIPALKPMIECFTNAGDLVLDPFCGSGSTLLAAKILKRRYLGIELDANYHAAATKRLQTVDIRASRGIVSAADLAGVKAYAAERWCAYFLGTDQSAFVDCATRTQLGQEALIDFLKTDKAPVKGLSNDPQRQY